jgi:hypothetical protein
MSTLATFVTLVWFGLACSGCTVIGFGLGSAIPHRTETPVENLDRDDDVSIEIKNHTEPLDGRYVEATKDDAIVVDLVDDQERIPRRAINKVYVNGSYWWVGALIGLAIDATIVGVAASNGCFTICTK